MDNPKLNILDVVSKRTRVSYRNLSDAIQELKIVCEALPTDDNLDLLDMLNEHPSFVDYTVPVDQERRDACDEASRQVDRFLADRG